MELANQLVNQFYAAVLIKTPLTVKGIFNAKTLHGISGHSILFSIHFTNHMNNRFILSISVSLANEKPQVRASIHVVKKNLHNNFIYTKTLAMLKKDTPDEYLAANLLKNEGVYNFFKANKRLPYKYMGHAFNETVKSQLIDIINTIENEEITW